MFKILEKLTAKNKKQDDIRMPSHLSAAEQKQVQTVIDRARGDRTVPHSAQESIPFQRMFPDGICRVTDNYYTKTIQFQDINYQLAQQEDQTAIFEEWCSFLNFFDSSIRFELSFMNMATDASNFEKMVRIPYQKDHFNPVRTEYSTMLRRQLAQGNNGLTNTQNLDVLAYEKEAMDKLGLIPEIAPRYRTTYFNHIIGGYAAGYYSYLWANVLDNDAFEAFKEHGIFDKKTADLFRNNVLEKGNSEDPMTLYKNFRGTEPQLEPMLKNRGMK